MFNKLRNKKGMTLIEVVVAFAIISIVSVVIIIGFRTMGGVMKEGSDVSRLDQELEKNIATSTSTSESGIKYLNLSGEAIQLKGTIKEYTTTDSSSEDGGTQTFRIFEAEEE